MIMKKIYQFIFFRLLHWQIDGFMHAEIKKCVIIVVPHTSWMDFVWVYSRGEVLG